MWSFKGRMQRRPYLIMSLLFFTITLFAATQVSLSARIMMDKFLGQSPGLRASASAQGYGRGDSDFGDGDAAAEAGARSDVSIYMSPQDARDTQSNYLLMYQAGLLQTVSVIMFGGGLAMFVVASSNRFHDLNQSGYFALLLFFPLTAPIWLYLILAPGVPVCRDECDDDDPCYSTTIVNNYIKNTDDHSVNM